jgi:drug/metabolite transporter (DMT)-like permease
MPTPAPHRSDDMTARLMLMMLSLGWGVTWSTMRIALMEIPPLSMRVATMFIGAVTLWALTRARGRSFALRSPIVVAHVIVAALFNVVGFSLFTPFAQLYAATSRVTILVYTMPIWASLLARFVLGERLTTSRALALALCVAGMAVLIYPLTATGVPLGIMLALGAAVSWAAGTVYLKWARIQAEPMAVTFWQILIAFVVITACLPVFEGSLHLWPLHAKTIVALVFSGLVGSGIAYFLWFDIVRRLPAMTASLGVLSVPAVGIVASVVMLGERPTVPDIVGFALIFAASGFVLLTPSALPATRERTNPSAVLPRESGASSNPSANE